MKWSGLQSFSMLVEDEVRIRHMIEAIESALRFVKGRSRHDLDRDEMFRFALVHAVEIMGEAASKVSLDARAEAAHLPWRQLIGMRNRLAHAYFDINLDILWATAVHDLPPLLPGLQFVKAKK